VSNALIIRAPNAVMLPPQQPRSLVHGFSLALVWLSVASGAIVLTEPAPVDLLTMALIVLLPIVGLVTIRPPLVVFLAVWLIAAAGAFISSITALDVAKSTIHRSSRSICIRQRLSSQRSSSRSPKPTLV
jgi:hypothetical protein